MARRALRGIIAGVTGAGTWLRRAGRLPARWRIGAALALAAVIGAAVLLPPLWATIQDRTRPGPQWYTADTYDADIREVFAVLADSTGVGGTGRDGLRVYVEAGGLYWLALDVAADGRARAAFFGLEHVSGLDAPAASGPRLLDLSREETAAFLARFDARLEDYWGLDTAADALDPLEGPLISWERRRDGATFGGRSVALPGNTYAAVSRDLRALLAAHLPPSELPDAEWNWPAAAR